MPVAAGAYGRLTFGPQGIEVAVVHANRAIRTVENPKPDGPLGLDPVRELGFTAYTAASVQRLVDALGIAPSHLPRQTIAYRCPQEWSEHVKRALAAAGCPEFDLLTVDEAESVCFFDEIESAVLPVARRWRERLRAKPGLQRHLNRVGMHEFESALYGLEQRTMTVALVGTMKAGKSTFMNALLGQFVLPALTRRCTRRRFAVTNSDEFGIGRRVQVTRWRPEGSNSDPLLGVDVDRLGWNTEQLRAYLFALNAPLTISSPIERLDEDERDLRQAFDRLPFDSPTTRDSVRGALAVTDPPIDTIFVTHPFHGLEHQALGRVAIWDTPGPDGIDDESVEAGTIRSDHATFQSAVQLASAICFVFDVTKQGSQSQFDVLKQIAALRGGRTGSLLVVANKVDLRQVRNVEPLDRLLENIRGEVQRHGLVIRPVVPVASRPAQLARELIRAGAAAIDDAGLQAEFETVVRRDDLRESPTNPEFAVERRSNIRSVEDIFVRFFRRESGRSILVNAVERTLVAVGEISQALKRELGSMAAEHQRLVDAANNLSEDAANLQVLIDEAANTLNGNVKSVSDSIERDLKLYKNLSTKEAESFWNAHFESMGNDPSSARLAQPEIEKKLLVHLDYANAAMQKAARNAELYVASFWMKVSGKLSEIEKRVDIKIGVKPEERRVELNFGSDFLKPKPRPYVRENVEKRSNFDGVPDAAKVGAGMGAAMGLGAAIAMASGPVGWGLLGGIAILTGGGAVFGGAAGGAVGVVAVPFRDEKVTSSASRSDVVNTYKLNITTSFDQGRDAFVGIFNDRMKATIAEIRFRASSKVSELHTFLQDARDLAHDSRRAERMENLRGEIAQISEDLQILDGIATRIGVRYQQG